MNTELKNALEKHCKALNIPFSNLDTIGESETHIKDIVIKIERDDHYESPREWDNVGTMVCWHRNYNLGDEQPSITPQEYQIGMIEEVEPGFEEILERFENQWPKTRCNAEGLADFNQQVQAKIESRLEKYFLMLPLYLYDHSGITMNTGGFSCAWDSSHVGFIYVSKEKARKEYGFKRLTEKRIQQCYKYLEGEVKTYASALEGNVYGYVIESATGDIDYSCWGFYGPEGEGRALEQALSEVVEHKKTRVAERLEKIKVWVKNQVPLLKRNELVTTLPVLY